MWCHGFQPTKLDAMPVYGINNFSNCIFYLGGDPNPLSFRIMSIRAMLGAHSTSTLLISRGCNYMVLYDISYKNTFKTYLLNSIVFIPRSSALKSVAGTSGCSVKEKLIYHGSPPSHTEQDVIYVVLPSCLHRFHRLG